MKLMKMAAILLAAAAPMAFGWTAGADESTNEVEDAVTSVSDESTPDAVDDASEIGETGEAISAGCPFRPSRCRQFCAAVRPGSFGMCVGPFRRNCVCRRIGGPPIE